jgi:hypothetical protein
MAIRPYERFIVKGAPQAHEHSTKAESGVHRTSLRTATSNIMVENSLSFAPKLLYGICWIALLKLLQLVGLGQFLRASQLIDLAIHASGDETSSFRASTLLCSGTRGAT